MNALYWGRIARVVVLALSTNSYAQTLTFPEVAQKTLAFRPEFQRFTIAAAQLEQQRLQAGLKPALELQSTLENVLGTGEYAGFDGAELSVGIGSSFERAEKRAARVNVVDAKSELLRREQHIAALDLLAETARRFVALARAQALAKLTRELQTQALRSVEQAKVRLAAAAAPKTDVLAAQLLFSEAVLQGQKAERAVRSAQLALAKSWGQDQADRLQAQLDLFDLPSVESEAQLLQQLMRTPDLRRFTSAARLHEAEQALAKVQAKADWQWSVGVRALQARSDQALIASFSIPLGSARRTSYAVREAQLRVEQVALDQRIEFARIESVLHGLLQQLADARSTEEMIRTQQLPQAKELYQLVQQGLELGRYSTRELALAQSQWLSLQRNHLEAAATFHLTRVEIERITGAALKLVETIQ